MTMQYITNILVDIVATALATVVLCLMKSAINWISIRCKHEKVALALQEFQTVLEDGVGYIEQTFVRTSKSDGTWDKASQINALESCIAYIKDNLTQKSLEILTEDKVDIETWITAKIEAYISSLKTE